MEIKPFLGIYLTCFLCKYCGLLLLLNCYAVGARFIAPLPGVACTSAMRYAA